LLWVRFAAVRRGANGRFRAALGLALALAVVLAAGVRGATAELTKIKVAFLPAEPAVLVTYAKHRGMFTKQGIDAEMVPRNDPQLILAALLSGDAQFSGTHAGAAAALKARGAPIKVVAAGALYDRTNPTSALVAAKGKTIGRARDLVGKTILIDAPNTIAHIGVLKWLKNGGVSKDDVTIKFVLFADMLASLSRGDDADAAFLPEPFLTTARQRGLKVAAYPFNAVCTKVCLLTFWIARADQDANLVARFRNAVQNAAGWANQPKNDTASARILARYVPIDAKVIAKMNRTRFATRLRPSLAQPWLDAFAEFGAIPAGFKAIDLVK
jgi:ABC-type nitrate/sulfonate/bicarbonate transport system substrate-binding protein